MCGDVAVPWRAATDGDDGVDGVAVDGDVGDGASRAGNRPRR